MERNGYSLMYNAAQFTQSPSFQAQWWQPEAEIPCIGDDQYADVHIADRYMEYQSGDVEFCSEHIMKDIVTLNSNLQSLYSELCDKLYHVNDCHSGDIDSSQNV